MKDKYVSVDGVKKAILNSPLIVDREDEKRLLRILDTMPDADVRENVHGSWGDREGFDEMFGYTYPCKVCGKIEIGQPNFCPNCGADMKVADDNG